jgi:hypothetical protein
VFPLNLYARVRFFYLNLHTRPRVQRAPGLPCALCLFLGVILQNLGRIAPRDRGAAIQAKTVMPGLDPGIHPSSQEFSQGDGLPDQARQ